MKTLEIGFKEFILEDDVFDLILSLSIERDFLRKQLEMGLIPKEMDEAPLTVTGGGYA